MRACGLRLLGLIVFGIWLAPMLGLLVNGLCWFFDIGWRAVALTDARIYFAILWTTVTPVVAVPVGVELLAEAEEVGHQS